jgi:hypothetical protein
MNQEIILQAAIARALIRMNGMITTNKLKELQREYPCYNEHDFCSIINEEGIGYNTVIEILKKEQ